MKKIPTIFLRDGENKHNLTHTPNPKCKWVFDGEGIATRKYDGTCCLVKNGYLFKRREVSFLPLLSQGEKIPDDFIFEDFDDVTEKLFGWVPVTDAPEDKWHREAFFSELPNGTYELLGKKINGNPEHIVGNHILLKHSEAEIFNNVPRDFEDLKTWLKDRNIEGIVFKHPDGRMAKIKKRDFGLKREVEK